MRSDPSPERFRELMLDEEPGFEDVRTALFHCPSCETVYIAEDKDVCGGCDHPVEQVPATLTRFR